jgi:hypothetical protein
MTRRDILLAALLVAALLTGPCDRAVADQPAPALGHDGLDFWTLQSLPDGPHDSQAIFEFDGHLLWLYTPCLSQSWVYQYDLGVLRVTNPSGSSVGCGGTRPVIVGAFDEAIRKASVPRLDGDVLTLLDGEGRPIVLLKRLATAGLENRRWHISAYVSGDELVSGNRMLSVSHIRFVHGNVRGSMFDGSPGCGTVRGSYSTNGRSVTISTGTFARGQCPDKALELTQTVVNALNSARSFDRDGERFVLRDAQGRVQVVLAPPDNR